MEQLPHYSSPGEQLKGADEGLLGRVLAEFEAAHAAALPACKLVHKVFTSELRRKLRELWDRTTGRLHKKFELAPGQPNPVLPVAPAPAGAGAAAASAEPGSSAAAGAGSAPAAAAATAAAGGGEEGVKREEEEGKEAAAEEGDYAVPPGFSAADLPAVDMCDGRPTKAGLVTAAVRRFLLLRKEVGALQGFESLCARLRSGSWVHTFELALRLCSVGAGCAF